ncbi:hypothetical protein [Williamsia sp. D3]|uniref:hypothetical protein n=1 Tax=Williamsia sp. D3 TaxID=1313067 RepID=UPI0003D38CF3|nr:hypothetical protein [Williamsia sp. D3]ETD31508.1 hypothetical protein W823_19115 [Williamsia sp. D3]
MINHDNADVFGIYFVLAMVVLVALSALVIACRRDKKADEDFDRYEVTEVDRGEIR